MVFLELFREPDQQIGYLFHFFSMGTILSLIMIISGLIILIIFRKKNEI
jgi:prolipoprotein diacylglyceryltransferase